MRAVASYYYTLLQQTDLASTQVCAEPLLRAC